MGDFSIFSKANDLDGNNNTMPAEYQCNNFERKIWFELIKTI